MKIYIPIIISIIFCMAYCLCINLVNIYKPIAHMDISIGILFRLSVIVNVSSTNSKQSELCVKSSCNIDTRLLRKATICSNCTQQVYDKIIKAPVS